MPVRSPLVVYVTFTVVEFTVELSAGAVISTRGTTVTVRLSSLWSTLTSPKSTSLTTPRGVMSEAEARAANVGGEVLCRVF